MSCAGRCRTARGVLGAGAERCAARAQLPGTSCAGEKIELNSHSHHLHKAHFLSTMLSFLSLYLSDCRTKYFASGISSQRHFCWLVCNTVNTRLAQWALFSFLWKCKKNKAVPHESSKNWVFRSYVQIGITWCKSTKNRGMYAILRQSSKLVMPETDYSYGRYTA